MSPRPNPSPSPSQQPQKPPIRWLNLLVLGLPPLVCLTVVPWYGLTHGYSVWEWLWFFILLTFCEMSITAGYHRLWSHRAYKAHPLLKFIYALGGACALQNHCITWASDHRRHHLHVDDDEKDPYSAGLGFWYSHFGWMIRDYNATREDLSNVKDLLDEPILVWQRKYYLPLTLFMNIGLPVLLGWLHGDVWGMFLLAGFLRLVLSQHFTYLINSAAHMWGKRQYSPQQTARDNWFIALFTFGEGYHNYHHTFAWDYRNGIKWYHYDPTKWLIKFCSWCGLARDLRSCSAFRQELTRLEVQFEKSLQRCARLKHAHHWQELLEKEYEAITSTLKHWYTLRQEWYQARSEALHESLHHLDLAHLRARYEEIKRQLRDKRRSWNSLQGSFALAHAAA